jgi:hypothetical protein
MGTKCYSRNLSIVWPGENTATEVPYENPDARFTCCSVEFGSA